MLNWKDSRIAAGALGVYLVIVWGIVAWSLSGVTALVAGVVMSVCGITLFSVYQLVRPAISSVQSSPNADRPASAESHRRTHSSDLDLVKDRLQTANQKLAASSKMRDRRALTRIDQLPLVLLIGNPGSGKTCVFSGAGLNSELLAGQIFEDQKVASTVGCNVWLLDETLVVEVGGRAFAEESDRFERILKLLRPGGLSFWRRFWGQKEVASNLRAVVLCAEVDQFSGGPGPDRQRRMAEPTKERLRAIGRVFGVDFPAYVVVTMSDKIKYFSEFFEHLSAEEHRQAVGSRIAPSERPLTYSAQTESERLTDVLKSVYFRLASRRIILLEREENSDVRLGSYEFPREFRRIRAKVVQYLVDAFAPGPLHAGPVLRGVYFTGARLMASSAEHPYPGAPAEDIDNNLTTHLTREEVQRRFGNQRAESPPDNRVTAWAFAHDFFTKVVLDDDGVGRRDYVDRRVEKWQRAAIAAGVVLFLSFGILSGRAWAKTRGFLGEVSQIANELPAALSRDDVLRALPALERFRQRLEDLKSHEEDGPPWTSVGLYPAESISDPARRLYFDRLEKYLLGPTESSIRRALEQTPNVKTETVSDGAVLDRLRAYLAITAKGCEVDADSLANNWQVDRKMDTASFELVKAQFQYYLEERKKGPVPISLSADESAISRGRRYLALFDPSEGIYRNFLAQSSRTVKAAHLGDYAARYGEVLTGQATVLAPFTADGFRAVQASIASASLSGDPCVFGADRPDVADSNQLRDRLRQRYVEEYVAVWRNFLRGLATPLRGGAAEVAKKLAILSERDSPILGAVFMAAENTRVVAQDKNETIVRTFQPAQLVFGPSATRERFVDERNQRYLEGLRRIQQAAERVAQSPRNPEAHTEGKAAVREALHAAKTLSDQFPRNAVNIDRAVERLLVSPIQEADRLFCNDPTCGGMDSGLRRLCKSLEPLRRQFPFNPRAQDEVSLADLALVFGPSGELGTFQRDYLDQLAEERNGQWLARRGDQGETRVNPELLRYFNRLSQISRALFRSGESQPGMDFTIRIAKPSNVTDLSLNAGESDRPPGEQSFRWPTPSFGIKVSTPSVVPMAQYVGQWSVFALAAEARHPAGGVLELHCVKAGPRSSCEPVSGTNGEPVVVKIETIRSPNGVAAAFEKGFLDLTRLTCPLAATR